MEFLVCQCDFHGYGKYLPLEDIKDEEEAISKAQDIALHTTEGFLVGLFTRDAVAVCGWKTMEGGKLRKEPAEVMQHSCGVGPGTFEFAKKQAEKIRKAREGK